MDHDLAPQGDASEVVLQGKAPKDAPFVRETAQEVDGPETAPQVQDPVPEDEVNEPARESSEPTAEVIRARGSTK